MKTRIKILMVLFLMFTGVMISSEKADARHMTISFQVFYDELSPYGSWVWRPDFGYVWIPDAGPDFYPYASNGQWIFTPEGWTWVSMYPWGWAPFHYGRWYIDDYWGPMWIPGYEWGPGWVVWRSSGDYCGWAPMGPGVTIEIAFGRNYFVPYHHWRFVRYLDFGRPDIYRHYVHHDHNVTIINHTTVINNVYVNNTYNVNYPAGPSRYEVEKRTGRSINPVAIKERSTPGQKFASNEVEIYRPKVERSASSGKAPAPAHTKKWETYEKERPVKYTPGTQANRYEPAKPATSSKPPVKYEPVKKEYNHSAPAKAEPVKREYNHSSPAKAEPVKKEYSKYPPVKAEPAKKEYGNAHPVKAEPAKKPAGTAKTQPAKPVNKAANHNSGGKTETMKAPAKTKPAAETVKKNGK